MFNSHCYCEFCIADEKIAFKVPENVTLEQAATIPLAATTAFPALFSPECLHCQTRKDWHRVLSKQYTCLRRFCLYCIPKATYLQGKVLLGGKTLFSTFNTPSRGSYLNWTNVSADKSCQPQSELRVSLPPIRSNR